MKLLIELPTWLGDSVMVSPAIDNLANYYNNNGEYEKALKYYFNALKSNKKNSSIISNIAIAYFNL